MRSNREFPKEWDKDYTPKSSEDSCRYCKHGFLHTNFKGITSWACNKNCGVFFNVGDYCGHFVKLDADLNQRINND